jgi:hypothetical protein
MVGDEADLERKVWLATFAQALVELGWKKAATCAWTFAGPETPLIGYQYCRTSWPALSPT